MWVFFCSSSGQQHTAPSPVGVLVPFSKSSLSNTHDTFALSDPNIRVTAQGSFLLVLNTTGRVTFAFPASSVASQLCCVSVVLTDICFIVLTDCGFCHYQCCDG